MSCVNSEHDYFGVPSQHVFRAVYGHAVAGMLAGADPDLVAADYLRELNRAFYALELGFAAAAAGPGAA